MEQGNYEKRTSAIYQRYRTWCQENGHYPESMKNFRQSLETVATVVRKRPKTGGNISMSVWNCICPCCEKNNFISMA